MLLLAPPVDVLEAPAELDPEVGAKGDVVDPEDVEDCAAPKDAWKASARNIKVESVFICQSEETDEVATEEAKTRQRTNWQQRSPRSPAEPP